ncbi:FMN-binding protein MioC [Shewanella gelidii]|uniref:FMN-binding protein MioC n=1 Tax=Shewanella gelidii TaxID=1642821 RepID=A0A917JXZ9_9GAMM|nr:FMN-binding protein MioC [Shewanella gelidii]MCL1099406.1 FMN-binding protein MioC [Shewanella gelidii]GGI91527.1 FMN-binding protein MioC [Shewanella gelidii]
MAKIEILVGTTLGGSEYVADEIDEQLQAANHQIKIHLQPKLSEIATDALWIIVSSTHGAGDLPDNITPFYQQLNREKPNLNRTKFAICAIGDSSYDTFCQGPAKLESLLNSLNASPYVDKIEIDVQQDPIPEEPAVAWIKSWLHKI